MKKKQISIVVDQETHDLWTQLRKNTKQRAAILIKYLLEHGDKTLKKVNYDLVKKV